jgi:hypothetical protein
VGRAHGIIDRPPREDYRKPLAEATLWYSGAMERRQTVIVVLVLAVGGAFLWFRYYFSPEQVVRRQVAAMASALEEEAILGVMSKISRSYEDDWGGSYETLGGYAHQVTEAYDDLDFDFGVTGGEHGDDWVRLHLSFTLTGTSSAGREAVLGSFSEPCTATVVWQKETPGWRFAETEELDIPEYRAELEQKRFRSN